MTCQHLDIGFGRELTPGVILSYDEESREGGEARRGGGRENERGCCFQKGIYGRGRGGPTQSDHPYYPPLASAISGGVQTPGLPVPPSPISVRQTEFHSSKLVPNLGRSTSTPRFIFRTVALVQ